MEVQSPRFFIFADYKIDSRRRILMKNDGEIPISAKNFDLLLELVKNEGKILSHDELLDTVWEGTFVEQSNLKKGISALRQILGETPESSTFIKTIPRKGYSFVASVRAFSEELKSDLIHVTATEVVIEEEFIEVDESQFSSQPIQPQLVGQSKTNWLKFTIPMFLGILTIIFGWLAFSFYSKNQIPTQFSALKLENLKPQRLSTGGDIKEATLSGDGKFFVYALRESDGKQSLWLRKIGSMNALNLVPAANVDFRSLTVSDDNDSVFYSISVGNSKDILYQIPILGGSPRKILEDIAWSPTFSADGKNIGFVRDKLGTGRSLLLYNLEKGQEKGEIFAVTGDNHGLISPKFSPDSSKFAFISSEKLESGRTWVLNEISAKGGKPRQLFAPRKGKIYDFSWLTDGSGIVMVAELNDSRQSQLWKVNIQNGEISRLTNDLLDYFKVNLTNDGKSILTMQEERKADLWKADVANLNQSEQVTRNINLPYRFAFTPDNKIIAESLENTVQTLSIVNLATAETQQFLTQTASDRSPNVTTDGKFVYYISRISGADQIWRAEINGSNPQKLTDGTTFIIHPRISPDGNSLYFEQYRETRWQLVKMPINGGDISLVSDDTTNSFDFSRDGKLLVYGYLDQATKKWKTRIRNISDNSIYKDFEVAGNTFIKFSPDNKSFIYNVSDIFRDGGNVWMQSLESGAPKPLIELKNEKIYWADFSNDGKTIYFTKGRTTSSAVLFSLETLK